MNWFSLPDSGMDLRSDNKGWYWRHQEPTPHDEGEGPYTSAEAAATDGADYVAFVHGS